MRFCLFFCILAVAAAGALGCSGATSSSPVLPGLTGQTASPEGHVVWATFDLALDPDTGTAEIIWDRNAEAHINVTSKLKPPACNDCIQVVSTSYNPATARFYVQMTFKNPTNYTGYDVRGVISNPGGKKFLVNSDGVTTVWGSPMQFRAINVDPERSFGPYEVHGRTFEFYLPPGENFKTLSYIIDASYPGPVTEPCIEQGQSDPLVNNNFSTTYLRCWVWDHQNDLNTVVCDLMPLGGSPMTTMYDDGQHNDGAAGDRVFGVTGVKTSAPVGLYMISVFAYDKASHMGWGQIPVSVQETTGGPNDPPIIQGVTTDRTTANGSKNEKIKITVNAIDPNGDALTYKFSGTGTFTQGATPNEYFWKPGTTTGKQSIGITVEDTKGGKANTTINLWSTNLSVINGSTQGMIPDGTIPCVKPQTTLHMSEDFMGEVCYINYWATWCGYCVAEMPDLTAMYNKLKGNPDYNQIFMNLQESESTVLNFINSHSFDCTYWGLDSNGSYFAKCKPFNNNATGIPQHFLFDRDGRCRWAHVGYLSSTSELESAINQLL